MPDLSPVTRWHQQVHDAQAVSGQRVLEGIDIELVEPIDKLLLPDNCFYAQPPYDYANVLDEGPNTSTVPVVDPCIWVGVRIAFLFDALLFVAWRAWPHIVAACAWLRGVM